MNSSTTQSPEAGPASAPTGSPMPDPNPALARLNRMRMQHATNRLRTGDGPLSFGEIIQSLTPRCRPTWVSELSDTLATKRLGDSANLPLRHQQHRVIIDDRANPVRSSQWLKIRNALIDKQGTGYLIGLLGPRGVGKTQIAVEVGLHRIAIKWPTLYCDAMDIFLWVRSTYGDDTGLCELDAISEFLVPSLLIIDEASQRGETAFEDRMLVYLLNKRYNAMLDTILIANMTPAEFRKSVGPSIVDRIRETGSLIECNWESKRAQAREQFGGEHD